MVFLVFMPCLIIFRAGYGVVAAIEKAEGAAFFEGVALDGDGCLTILASEMDVLSF